MVISKEFYCDMKDYFYPNIRKFIHNYTCMEDNLFFLPPYHGCGLKNKVLITFLETSKIQEI